MRASYVLPLKWSDDGPDGAALEELTTYLRFLTGLLTDVLVVDGSAADLFAGHARAFAAAAPGVRHLRPDPRWRFANGKVDGVSTGVVAAAHEEVVIADDDVRYDRAGLARVVGLLWEDDLVRPQNYFVPAPGSHRLPWHARWDTARTLLNRAWTADYPGTFGIRRSTFLAMGGYDGDVLFENLELIRTVRGHGGTEVRPLGLFVARLAPPTGRFWGQRRRQAYDDLAQPGRMAAGLAVLPGLALAGARRRPGAVLAGGVLAVAAAERGRRRCGGAAVYPAGAALMAPLWLLERGVCDWLALGARLRGQGVAYGGRRLLVAAHSGRELRSRAARRTSLRQALPDRSAEVDQAVRAVAEGFDPGGAAPAQGDGAPIRSTVRFVDGGTVRCGEPERAADQQRTVSVGRDRRGGAVGPTLGFGHRLLRALHGLHSTDLTALPSDRSAL